jgi:diacylglycerol kinase (ATP)
LTQKTAIIINRKCYQRRGARQVDPLINSLGQYSDQTVFFTEHDGHATQIAQNLTDYDTIIAAGGDGTIGEVINGMALEKQVLGIIPIGVGNTLARELRIHSPDKAIDAIKKNEEVAIDIMDCRFKTRKKAFRRYAFATTGLGYPAAAADLANRRFKSTGWLCYSLASVLRVFNQKIMPAELQIDGGESKQIKFTFFMVNNGKYSGNIYLFPRAEISDSALNVFYAKSNAVAQLFADLFIITRTYLFNPGIHEEFRRLSLKLKNPTDLMLDGEIFGSVEEVTYSVVPKGLKIFA